MAFDAVLILVLQQYAQLILVHLHLNLHVYNCVTSVHKYQITYWYMCTYSYVEFLAQNTSIRLFIISIHVHIILPT